MNQMMPWQQTLSIRNTVADSRNTGMQLLCQSRKNKQEPSDSTRQRPSGQSRDRDPCETSHILNVALQQFHGLNCEWYLRSKFISSPVVSWLSCDAWHAWAASHSTPEENPLRPVAHFLRAFATSLRRDRPPCILLHADQSPLISLRILTWDNSHHY